MIPCSPQDFNRSTLCQAQRVLVKVGTRVVTDPEAGLDMIFLDRLARQIARLHQRGLQVLVVTSGSVHLGKRVLGRRSGKETLTYRQAAAAIGQPELMRSYSIALSAHGLIPAQVLLTRDDVSDRKRYLHIRNSLELLLANSIVPVINENDSVSVDGVTFVENDILAAMVATKLRMDLLIYLSDSEGLCTADPRLDPRAELISCVLPGENYENCAAGAGGVESRGGMKAKIQAARLAADHGVPVVMASSEPDHVLLRILQGEEIGTLFVPREARRGRRVWIATAGKPLGSLMVDEGACQALRQPGGASLLPAGVTGTVGHYEAGDLVAVMDPEGSEVARGLVNYSCAEVTLIQGAHSSQVAEILGHDGPDEVIHRDNLVLMGD